VALDGPDYTPLFLLPPYFSLGKLHNYKTFSLEGEESPKWRENLSQKFGEHQPKNWGGKLHQILTPDLGRNS